jgi:hypothetical protein
LCQTNQFDQRLRSEFNTAADASSYRPGGASAEHDLMSQPTQKIYAFVDESGQETNGALFLVSVVVTDHEYDHINDTLIEIEERSGKRLKKWSKARFEYRLAYIEAVIGQPIFRGLILFSCHANSQAYFDLTVEATARAIHHKNREAAPATVVVDGLRGRDVNRFKTKLRGSGVNVRKVRGARDESEPIVRLADAVAGFVRDFLEGQTYAAKLYEKAIRDGIFGEL